MKRFLLNHVTLKYINVKITCKMVCKYLEGHGQELLSNGIVVSILVVIMSLKRNNL